MVLGDQAAPVIRTRVRSFELAGMPGCGKSTLFRLVQSRAAAQSPPIAVLATVPAMEALEYVEKNLPVLWRRSEAFVNAVGRRRSELGHGSIERMTRSTAELWFGRVALVHQANRGKGASLLEEGTVHELWRLAYLLRGTPFERSVLQVLGPLLPRSSVVVHVVASAETRFRRMSTKRSLGPINRDLAAHGPESDVWREWGATYDRLARQAGRWPRSRLVLRNDVDGAEEAIAETLVRTLQGRQRRLD